MNDTTGSKALRVLRSAGTSVRAAMGGSSATSWLMLGPASCSSTFPYPRASIATRLDLVVDDLHQLARVASRSSGSAGPAAGL